MIQAPAQYRIHRALTISALPEIEDFALMAEQGYEIVISLCQSVDSVTLENEDALVSEAGMKYLHLPVDFYHPKPDDYLLLADMLRVLYGRKVWLHCAKNWRVSAMMYLYRIIELTDPISEAEEMLHSIWRPDAIWQQYIDEVLEKYAFQYL